jgi:succinate dehydrogenase / fumarate reductase flavoprotein subunit
LNYGIDMTKEPLFVYPTQHYQNGGVDMVDAEGRSSLPGLFLAGEVAGGVQGRNRLGGNSLVDIFVFGRRAGQAAAREAREAAPGRLTLQHVRAHHRALEGAGIATGTASPLLLPDYVVPQERKGAEALDAAAAR